jgi:hypothetical protein
MRCHSSCPLHPSPTQTKNYPWFVGVRFLNVSGAWNAQTHMRAQFPSGAGIALPCRDPTVLTPVPSSPPAQVLEGRPLQGCRPGAEGPAGCLWHQCPQHDVSCHEVDVPPLPAAGSQGLLCSGGRGYGGFEGSRAIWLLDDSLTPLKGLCGLAVLGRNPAVLREL